MPMLVFAVTNDELSSLPPFRFMVVVTGVADTPIRNRYVPAGNAAANVRVAVFVAGS